MHILLTKIMANKLRGLYIRVNAIAPGMFPSQMNNPEAIKAWTENGTVDKIPAKKLGSTEEMGSAAIFLATNSYVDGQVLVVDGGRSLTANGS
jgi:NAD(P)-dependent dehydrogenase (short-subunit alcohol dehydrogenase family)